MKKLRQYLNFSVNDFFKTKQLLYLDVKPLYRFDDDGNRTDEQLGVTVGLVITQDKSEGSPNLYEKLNVKVLDKTVEDIESQFEKGKTILYFKSVSKAIVYGQFMNQLSITGELDTLENIKAKQGNK